MITTTQTMAAGSPGLLRNSIDERIARVRPMSTPIDQLSRCAGARHCDSMEVEYYSVATKPTQTTVSQKVTMYGTDDRDPDARVVLLDAANPVSTIHVSAADQFEATDTLLLPEYDGYGTGGVAQGHLAAYVVSRNTDAGTLKVRWLNLPPTDKLEHIASGAAVVRMGRAASELDVQTAQFDALPQKDSNYCQIFKMQVEQSTLAKIAAKEVEWTFSDQEEVAIIDMRLGMEKNFLFGHRGYITDPDTKARVTLTGGIWGQASRSFQYTRGALDSGVLVSLCRKAFTSNAGSHRKILVAGSGLVDALSRLEYDKVISAGQTRVKWGIEFTEIRSNFGSLYVVHSEVFDQCGHADDGFILDPEYLTKYVHVPFQTQKLDLRTAGMRNTDAVVLTEASCLVLRYPDSHLRVEATGTAPAS